MRLEQCPITVGVDGSAAALGAVRWAADEAARQHRTLRIVHALRWAAARDGQGLVLEAAAEAHASQPGIAVRTASLGGSPARVLREESRTAALIVIGGHAHDDEAPVTDGGPGEEPVSVHLAGFAHCPVLVVNDGWRWADPAVALPGGAPVVVGVDGSPSSRRALDFGYGEAASRRVPLLAVHAGAGHDEHRHEAVADALEPWRRRHPQVETRFTGRDSGLLEALTDAAREALMLVVGAHRVGWYERPRPNPVTQRLVHRAAAPVLVTRSV